MGAYNVIIVMLQEGTSPEDAVMNASDWLDEQDHNNSAHVVGVIPTPAEPSPSIADEFKELSP